MLKASMLTHQFIILNQGSNSDSAAVGIFPRALWGTFVLGVSLQALPNVSPEWFHQIPLPLANCKSSGHSAFLATHNVSAFYIFDRRKDRDGPGT